MFHNKRTLAKSLMFGLMITGFKFYCEQDRESCHDIYKNLLDLLDTVAAYGIRALVAALVFLKKFAILILIGLGAFLKGIFSRKKHNKVLVE